MAYIYHNGQIVTYNNQYAVATYYGPERISNGTFTDATGWSNLVYWSISGGLLNFGGALTSYCAITAAFIVGKQYLVQFDKTNSPANGRLLFYANGTTPLFAAPYNGYLAFSAGHNSIVMTCAAYTAVPMRVYANATYGAFSIDNLSMTQVF